MRRLFFTFLRGWPGIGLLLLRLTLACSLLANAAAMFDGPALSQLLPALAGILMAALITIGLCTPIAGVAVCLLQFSMAFTTAAAPEPLLLRAAMGLSLALLGPGIWSIDARLYGRKRVEIKSLRDV